MLMVLLGSLAMFGVVFLTVALGILLTQSFFATIFLVGFFYLVWKLACKDWGFGVKEPVAKPSRIPHRSRKTTLDDPGTGVFGKGLDSWLR